MSKTFVTNDLSNLLPVAGGFDTIPDISTQNNLDGYDVELQPQTQYVRFSVEGGSATVRYDGGDPSEAGETLEEGEKIILNVKAARIARFISADASLSVHQFARDKSPL